ncbi:MAG: hypothetical protein R2795_13715 [Saprospiraceae bacterium]
MAVGFNFQHIIGYQFNRYIGLGVGASYDAYELTEGESLASEFSGMHGLFASSPCITLLGGFIVAMDSPSTMSCKE